MIPRSRLLVVLPALLLPMLMQAQTSDSLHLAQQSSSASFTSSDNIRFRSINLPDGHYLIVTLPGRAEFAIRVADSIAQVFHQHDCRDSLHKSSSDAVVLQDTVVRWSQYAGLHVQWYSYCTEWNRFRSVCGVSSDHHRRRRLHRMASHHVDGGRRKRGLLALGSTRR